VSAAPLRVVLATGNRGKLREFAELLAPLDFAIEPQSAFGIEPPEETGDSFAANALLKARHAAGISGLPALADDSGLEVDALGGAPGVRSARYAGEHASDADNIAKLLASLEQAQRLSPAVPRDARFRCVIAFVRSATDPQPLLASGAWEGRILAAPRGTGGFGYDPLFEIVEYHATFGELSATVKHALSHRGRAMARLRPLLRAVTSR
jgi:XTP/dITP diphosphohydrolase